MTKITHHLFHAGKIIFDWYSIHKLFTGMFSWKNQLDFSRVFVHQSHCEKFEFDFHKEKSTAEALGIKAQILLFLKVKESTYFVLQLHNIDSCVLTYEITCKIEILGSTVIFFAFLWLLNVYFQNLKLKCAIFCFNRQNLTSRTRWPPITYWLLICYILM